MIQERLREAEARGALNSMLREASRLRQTRDTAAGRRAPGRHGSKRWWQTSAAWVGHLALPKMWNRL